MIESVLSIYWTIFRRRPFIIMALLVTYVGIVGAFVTLTKIEKNDKNAQEKVVEAVIKSIDSKQDVESLSDRLEIVFNSYDRKSNGELQQYGYVQVLEDAFTEESTKNATSEKLGILVDVIQKEKVRDPFYGLRFEQELVIKNLESLLNGEENKLLIVNQVKEIVRRQNIEIDELKKNNAMGIPLGIAGLVFTVIFGLLGLSYPLVVRNKRRLTNKD